MSTNAAATPETQRSVSVDRHLQTFLKPFKNNGQSSEFTIGSMLENWSGTYTIKGAFLDDFYKLYCKRLNDQGPNFVCGLTENPAFSEYEPVLVDIDIKISYDSDIDISRHIYKQHHVDKVIAIYHDILRHICVGLKPEHLICFVKEKPSPYVDQQLSGRVIKNGFHLHFPFLCMSKWDLEIHLATRARDRLDQERVFADIEYIDNPSSHCLDTGLTKKCWLLYGSRKKSFYEPYKLTRIVNHLMEDISIEDAFENIELKNYRDEVIVSKNTPNLWYHLPIILSIAPYGRPQLHVNDRLDCNSVKSTFTKASVYANDNSDLEQSEPLPEVLRIARDLVNMLNPARADDHDQWHRVGQVLFKVCRGCVEGVDIWYEFSKKAQRRTHVDEARCLYEWGNMKYYNFNLGTLFHWAREDNPEAYEQYSRNRTAETMRNSFGGGEDDIATILHDKFQSSFKCVNFVKNQWYYFNGVRWDVSDGALELMQCIKSYVIPLYMKHLAALNETLMRAYATDASANNPNGDVRSINSQQEPVKKVLARLRTMPFKKLVVQAACLRFYDKDFINELDQNPFLVGFNNGVLDLQELKFRPAKPSDFISKTVGYNFEDFSNNMEDARMRDVVMFWRKVLPDADVRTWFMEYLGKLLQGVNMDQNWLIMSGTGANGKSASQSLIQAALGGNDMDKSYSGLFPTSLITSKNESSSNSASPELYAAIGKRVMWVTEPDDNTTINYGVVKKLTGDEYMYCRPLFEKPINSKILFKLVYICNKVPKLVGVDDAVWRRVCYIPFPSSFPDDDSLVPERFEDQERLRIFYRDRSFNHRIPELRSAMMYLMFLSYKSWRLRGRNLPLPAIVKQAIEIYKKDNDMYFQFTHDVMRQDSQASISTLDAYNYFKQWFIEYTGSNKGTPSRKDFIAALTKKTEWGEPRANRWFGWRLQRADDTTDQQVVFSPPATAAVADTTTQ